MTARERSPDELAEDLAELNRKMDALMAELKSGYVPRELYEARHKSLRAEIALEMAAMRRDLDSKASAESLNAVSGKAESAHRIAWGVFVLLGGALLTVLVGFLMASGA